MKTAKEYAQEIPGRSDWSKARWDYVEELFAACQRDALESAARKFDDMVRTAGRIDRPYWVAAADMVRALAADAGKGEG